ncbi:tRNA pseudouridine(55) synthase TruB [Candidatus Peribacteria bacterium RIFCSPLOWO2_01_FULL_51_18]|nr:MAG: tRNA pseudouridine(55) synthase TruB [Candidatus Peribacteria bacterium RIFCSPHIGHO2_02_FULL_51_15]OGJ64949.1 MAG: tRNA pseudouridine(55) synthase TruB [Candidatus Peribacteria bacterium RIFCSPLOWO2_01_FULL_51_18]OGJ68417.1 MAG: tRNA pseudouridine(55) synthase TruB [Candidatus Peribacteria bacterium RIFCSPLOWO2_02_FULL_51_10]
MRHGFILLHKPRGPTSHDMVDRVRRLLNEAKVGHLGTLDPMAEGLLVLAVGAKALKVIELFKGLTKEYLATVTLGAVSTTYDAEGSISMNKPKAGWLPPEDASRIQALIDDRFLGKISQIPPAYSAVHVGGTRAYRKAMRGEKVELKSREITIIECKVKEYAYPKLVLWVHCDSGTYIRSLAHDLGECMRCGGYLDALTRTKVGNWDLKKSIKPEDLNWTDVIPLKEILKNFPRIDLMPDQFDEIRFGRSITGEIDQSPLIAWYDGLPVAAMEKDYRDSGRLKAKKIF